MKKWQVLKSTVDYDTRWVKVRKDQVKLPNGTVIDDYYVVENKPWVLIVPYTNDGQMILVHQYKHAYGGFLTEFPAGFIDTGEKPATAAKRELLEETGYKASKIEFLGELTNNPTTTVEKFYVFRATGCVKTARPKFDITEDIETILKTPKEVDKMIKSGEIFVSSSITAGLLERLKRGDQ